MRQKLASAQTHELGHTTHTTIMDLRARQPTLCAPLNKASIAIETVEPIDALIAIERTIKRRDAAVAHCRAQ